MVTDLQGDDLTPPDLDEVLVVSRGIATAVAPDGGITDLQATVLHAVTKALTDIDVDYCDLDPIEASELGAKLAARPPEYRQRIVHHMVLGELVLRPLPHDVAERVASFASALGIEDNFVPLARRYAEGAFGVAWVDLRRNGFAQRWDATEMPELHTMRTFDDPFEHGGPDPELEKRWEAFADLPVGTLGRSVYDMYLGRGFELPGNPMGAPAFLAQHDFVHVLADYGTNLEGELEAFALCGRADPDPKGFAWIATMVGLFETGYVPQQGFFKLDVKERHLESEGMGVRFADALRRGKAVAEGFGKDLFRVDFHALAAKPLDEIRTMLCLPPKAPAAIAAGSAGLFDPEGMSEVQREAAAAKAVAAAEAAAAADGA